MNFHSEKFSSLADKLLLYSFVDKVVKAISSNEGSFTDINQNDAGYGISIGIRQWNQKAGELPDLFAAWAQNVPAEFASIFGPEYADKIKSEKWVRSYNMAADLDLMARIKLALSEEKMQKVQIDLARAFVKNAIKLGSNYGFSSELGLALVCDMVNQTGRSGTEAALARAGLSAGASIESELDAANTLAASSARHGGQQRYAALRRSFAVVKAEF